MQVCEKYGINEINATFESQVGDWMDEGLGNQNSWSEKSSVRSRRMRMALLSSSRGIVQFRREICSAMKSNRLFKASAGHGTSMHEIIRRQLSKGMHVAVEMIDGHQEVHRSSHALRYREHGSARDIVECTRGEMDGPLAR